MYIETMQNMFFDAYLACALWASTNDKDGEPLDSYYSVSDFDPKTATNMRIHALKFFTDNIDLINAHENYSYDQAGHDLWLTENGHGVGFWARGLGVTGDKLTKLAENHPTDLYVGDDNKIYSY